MRTLTRSYPTSASRKEPDCPALWLELTRSGRTVGDVRMIGRMPDHAQRELSRIVSATEEAGVERQVRADRSSGWEARSRAYSVTRGGWAGDIYTTQPWQESGALHCDNAVWLVTAFVHFRRLCVWASWAG